MSVYFQQTMPEMSDNLGIYLSTLASFLFSLDTRPKLPERLVPIDVSGESESCILLRSALYFVKSFAKKQLL
jgi:hypothetical protein